MPKNRNKIRNDVIKEIRLLLGDGMIDIELDPEHYDVALDVAVSKITTSLKFKFNPNSPP